MAIKSAWVYCPDCGAKLQPLYYRERGHASNLRVRDRFYCVKCDKVVKIQMIFESEIK